MPGSVPVRSDSNTQGVVSTLNITWDVVVALALLLAVICFLAVLWSKREWTSRKIRVGMFLEREYKDDPPSSPDTETTKEWPRRKEE